MIDLLEDNEKEILCTVLMLSSLFVPLLVFTFVNWWGAAVLWFILDIAVCKVMERKLNMYTYSGLPDPNDAESVMMA